MIVDGARSRTSILCKGETMNEIDQSLTNAAEDVAANLTEEQIASVWQLFIGLADDAGVTDQLMRSVRRIARTTVTEDAPEAGAVELCETFLMLNDEAV